MRVVQGEHHWLTVDVHFSCRQLCAAADYAGDAAAAAAAAAAANADTESANISSQITAYAHPVAFSLQFDPCPHLTPPTPRPPPCIATHTPPLVIGISSEMLSHANVTLKDIVGGGRWEEADGGDDAVAAAAASSVANTAAYPPPPPYSPLRRPAATPVYTSPVYTSHHCTNLQHLHTEGT